MARQTCPVCGGSGVVGPYHENKDCYRCYRRGFIEVPDEPKPYDPNKPACFPKGTKILTPLGWKNIEEISKDELVISFNTNSEISVSKVFRKLEFTPRKIFTVITKSPDFIVKATKNHAIYTNRGWVQIQKLKIGDYIMKISENKKIEKYEVKEILDSEKWEPVYNLIVSEDFSFIADGCIAHSFSYFRKLRIAACKTLEYFESINRKNILEGSLN